MKKIDELLEKAAFFEKLANHGNRSRFLKAIAQDENNSKEHRRCNCENLACEEIKAHRAGSCPNKAGDKKAMYIGSICDKCAEKMEPEFMLNNDTKKIQEEANMSSNIMRDIMDYSKKI